MTEMPKKFLVTGATGFIGGAIVNELINRGYGVHCLYRDRAKTKSLNHPGISLFEGDILDAESIRRAAAGCDGVFHTAAFTGITASANEIYDLNVTGMVNVLEAARETGAGEIVFTSTAGVLGPSSGSSVDENTERITRFFIRYEETKAEAEKRALEFLAKGLNVRIVNPTRVYGPGPLVASNSVTKMISLYSKGRWRIIPGNGKSIGNYVYVGDVARGHILAMERGKPGERYILGGENCDFLTFFKTVASVTGRSYKMIKLPLSVMLAAAKSSELISFVAGGTPFITTGHVRRYNHDWRISSGKAEQMLGYTITPLREGIAETVRWLEKNSNH